MSTLKSVARQAMQDYGFLPDFSPQALTQLGTLPVAARDASSDLRDLRHLLWASIDNDDSRDLDQLSAAELLANDTVKVLVAIADVDCLVKADTPIDAHAAANTTSVYTAAQIFPMLPEKLSTDLHLARPGSGSPEPRRRNDMSMPKASQTKPVSTGRWSATMPSSPYNAVAA